MHGIVHQFEYYFVQQVGGISQLSQWAEARGSEEGGKGANGNDHAIVIFLTIMAVGVANCEAESGQNAQSDGKDSPVMIRQERKRLAQDPKKEHDRTKTKNTYLLRPANIHSRGSDCVYLGAGMAWYCGYIP